IRDPLVTGVQTCALPISGANLVRRRLPAGTTTLLSGVSLGRGTRVYLGQGHPDRRRLVQLRLPVPDRLPPLLFPKRAAQHRGGRSEERRVGKEGRLGKWA